MALFMGRARIDFSTRIADDCTPVAANWQRETCPKRRRTNEGEGPDFLRGGTVQREALARRRGPCPTLSREHCERGLALLLPVTNRDILFNISHQPNVVLCGGRAQTIDEARRSRPVRTTYRLGLNGRPICKHEKNSFLTLRT